MLSKALLFATCAASAFAAQIYLSPAEQSTSQLSVSPAQVNELLSHRLGLSRFERLGSQSISYSAEDPFEEDRDSLLLLVHGDSASGSSFMQSLLALSNQPAQTTCQHPTPDSNL